MADRSNRNYRNYGNYGSLVSLRIIPKFPKIFKLPNLSFFTFHLSLFTFALCSNFSNLPFALPTIFTGTIFRTREAIGEKIYF